MLRSRSFAVCLLTLFVLSSLGGVAHSLYTYKVGNKTKTATNNLTVHVISHTHCDPGWLKTVDEYYLGANNEVYWAGVQYILDSVIDELTLYPNRKFIFVEMAFFSRWWNEQNNATKAQVRTLVNNGQFEFINGGWSMHDEAASYYEDQIDNMAVGHQFIKDNFNVTPTIGWQIDPFGHSSSSASFFSQMGFNGMWFARVDYQDKQQRMNTQQLEMVWSPQTSLNGEDSIYASVNYAHYSAPSGFCFDLLGCGDEPIMYDPDLEYYNVDAKAEAMAGYFRNMAESYRTDQLLHTWGDDFNYQAAGSYFKNLDKLIEAVNDRYDLYGIKMVYSTPSVYLQALQANNFTNFPNKTDDFFPYADGPDAFWTGYFTSRVSEKGYTRDSGRTFQNVRRLLSQTLIQNSSDYVKQNIDQIIAALAYAEQNRGLLEHHDAISGTAKQRVKEDYIYLMYKAMAAVHDKVTNPILQETTRKVLNYEANYTRCNINETAEICNVTLGLNNNQSVLVAIYNTVGERNQIVRIKVPTTQVQVYTQNGSKLATDVICVNQTSTQDCDLFFQDDFATASTQFYFLTPTSTSNQVLGVSKKKFTSHKQVLFASKNRSLTVYKDLATFTLNEGQQSSSFRIKYNYYPSECQNGQQNSGAYIFRPQDNYRNGSIPYALPSDIVTFSGNVVNQITTYYGSVTTNLRFAVNSDHPGVEIDTFVDSINIQDNIGKEVVMLIDVLNIDNNGEFYTDSNGQQMQHRILNYRPTWNLSSDQTASSNYYPVTSAIYIQDKNTGLRATLLTDRAHGATSLQAGQIEVMLNRRMLCDDGRGVGEALNETGPNGQGLTQWLYNRLIFSNNDSQPQRTAQFHADQPLMVLLSPHVQVHHSFIDRVLEKIHPIIVEVLGLRHSKASLKALPNLPANVKANWKPLSSNEFVLWLHNLNENQTTVVPVSYFNSTLGQYSLDELNLSANQLKTTMIENKLRWNNQNASIYNPTHENITAQIELRPLEVRAFSLVLNQ